MLPDGTFLILLANPDSHFSLQKPIYIIGDAGLKTQGYFANEYGKGGFPVGEG
jgi:hypothetical protein